MPENIYKSIIYLIISIHFPYLSKNKKDFRSSVPLHCFAPKMMLKLLCKMKESW